MPSTCWPGILYAAARGIKLSTAQAFSTAIPIEYWLFSQIYTTGNFQIDARLSDSWKAPSSTAPSPKNQPPWYPSPGIVWQGPPPERFAFGQRRTHFPPVTLAYLSTFSLTRLYLCLPR